MEILSILERYEKENTQKRDGEVKVITLNYRDIYSIGFIPDRFRYIEELYLNHNSIEQLNGIQQFPFLRLLSVKFNMIPSVDQFLLILNKKSLTCLNFIGNPVEKEPECTKEFFLRTFPNLEELNDKSIHSTGLKYIDTTPLTARQQNAMTVMTAIDSLKSISSQERSIAVENLKSIGDENSNRARDVESYKEKGNIKFSSKGAQDSSIILTDHEKYETLAGFNHQKTATFAQTQALRKESKYPSHYFTNEEPCQLGEMTERFASSQILPFLVDQSRINEQTHLQEKSIENFVMQNTLRKDNTKPKVSGICNKSSFGQDVNYIESKSNLDLNLDQSQVSNLFDKHIENIDKDIHDLARIFHEKSLKEKTLKSLRIISGVNSENNNKANKFRNNIIIIRVFYAWLFYKNTARRKEALIHAISEPRNMSQISKSLMKDQSVLKMKSSKDNSSWQNMLPFLESSDNEKTKRHNYFMTEDFV